MPPLNEYRDLKKGEQIYVGVDTSDGCGDWSVGQFFSSKRFDFPLVLAMPEIATSFTDELFPILEYVYDCTGIEPLVAYERAKGGACEMDRLARLNKQGKFDIFRMPIQDPSTGTIEKADKLGWDTNTATRPQMLSHLKEAVDNRLIHIYDKATINEMFSFVRVQHSSSVKAEAEKNAHDDRVMASAIAYEMYLLYPDLGRNSGALQAAQRAYERSLQRTERGSGGY